jgi:DNA polymerase I-like protein with 3'-5' exonuclease and polymerase domains
VKEYQRKGYFDLVTGFRCSGVMRKNEVINYRIQGPAFHCLLWCFIQIDKISQEEGWDSRLINQVYDSMVVDAHPDELEYVAKTIHHVATVELPKAWPWIIVPLEIEADACEVDEPWSEKKPYKLEQ